MDNQNEITQKEIDNLGADQDVGLQDDIKNIIILFRNELNILEKNIDKYPDVLRMPIKKKLNNLLNYILHIRKSAD